MSSDCNTSDSDSLVDLYKVLGCDRTATIEEIKKKYQKLALSLHPDKSSADGNSDELFMSVQKAWSVLRDLEKRKEYDAFLTCYEHNNCLLYNNITLSEMDDMGHGVYSFRCRCSGTYELELTESIYSKVIISCDECSLSILVNLDKT